jgi:hypothetical protein
MKKQGRRRKKIYITPSYLVIFGRKSGISISYWVAKILSSRCLKRTFAW